MEYDKILFSRLLSSFLWTIALQVFPLCLYILITNVDLVHPVEWFVSASSIVFSLATWLSLMPIHGLIFAIGYIVCQEHKKSSTASTSRFKFACSLFTKSNLLKCVLYFFLGVVVTWTYLNVNNFETWVECQESTQTSCLNENSVFLITCGAWTSLFYFIRYDVFTEKHLQFPIIRQLKFLQIRYKFLNVLHDCLFSSFLPLLYYLPFYMWYRKPINLLFQLLLTASIESSKLSGIACLFQLPVLMNAWLLCTVFYTIIKTLDLMIEIHLTEHFSFTLIKQPNSKSILLSQALGEHHIPIIQHLACYDLYILSMSQKSIRWQIFTLSQPGGHPHTWNAVLQKSLKLIEEFICQIEVICKVPQPVRPKSPVPRHVHTRDMTLRHEEIISGPVPLSPVPKLRNLMEQPGRPVPKEQPQSAMTELWTRLDAFLEKIKRNSVVNYIFGSKPDAEIRFLLSKSQPLIWIVQSLSELSANALREDQFGIVLNDLPVIISTLLQLKTSLDKLGNIQSNKLHRTDHDLCMRASLKSAVRRSLYRIAIAYSEYLTDLPLSAENLNSMKNFVNFKEC